jgi:hypothetical protein
LQDRIPNLAASHLPQRPSRRQTLLVLINSNVYFKLRHSSSSLCQFPLDNTAKMGCGMSTEEKEGKARNEEIENQLKKDRLMQRNEIKMLLLGKLFDRDKSIDC